MAKKKATVAKKAATTRPKAKSKSHQIQVVQRCPDDPGELAEQLGGRLARYGAGLLGGGISRLFGKGDYEVKTNSLIAAYGGPSAGPAPPLLFRGSNHGTRVVEREYLGTITGSTTFANTVFRINPADSTTFPWLSRIAAGFEQWEPNGIVFEFRSTSSTFNGSSQALGAVIMATDYDPNDAEFSNRIEMSNSDYATTLKSSDHGVHGVECDETQRPTRLLYTASSADGNVHHRRFSDLGNFQIATDGLSSSVVIGELWVAYDVTFYKKSMSETSDWGAIDVAIRGTSGYSIANPLGSAYSILWEDLPQNMGFQYVTGSGASFRLTDVGSLKGRQFRLTWTQVQTAAMTGTAPTVSSGLENEVQTLSTNNGTALVMEYVGDMTGDDVILTFAPASVTGVAVPMARLTVV